MEKRKPAIRKRKPGPVWDITQKTSFSSKACYNSQTLIKDELLKMIKQKKKQNPNYSLVAFSKELGCTTPYLSSVLRGKRPIRRFAAKKYVKPLVSKTVWNKIEEEFKYESEIVLSRPKKSVKIYSEKNGEKYLNEDQKVFYSDPICFALLHVFELEDFNPSLKWIASRLRLTVKEAKEKLKLLVRLGLLTKQNDQYMSNGTRPVLMKGNGNHNHVPAHTLKLSALLNDFICNQNQKFDGTKRGYSEFNWWYFALDPKDIDDLKREIESFIKKFQRRQLPSASKEVYSLGINLFPLTKKMEN